MVITTAIVPGPVRPHNTGASTDWLRNVVGGQNFGDTPGVITFIIVAGIVGLILLLPTAGELGRRTDSSSCAT